MDRKEKNQFMMMRGMLESIAENIKETLEWIDEQNKS